MSGDREHYDAEDLPVRHGWGCCVPFAALAAVAAALCGCSTATPASRATTATYQFRFGDMNRSTLNLTLGDGALASADSSGSTETQTATPTVDVRPDIDVRYNDAIAGATTASKGVLETLLQSSAEKVLGLMSSKQTGTVEVQKKDGTSATVKCEGGQCSFADGGTYDPDFPAVDDGIND